MSYVYKLISFIHSYGIIKVKYLESLLTILFVSLLFSFIMITIIKYILSYLKYIYVTKFIHDILQSAFRKCHSTVTALLKILNNIWKVSPSLFCHMVLIYFSCVFDSLCHDILISRIEMINQLELMVVSSTRLTRIRLHLK